MKNKNSGLRFREHVSLRHGKSQYCKFTHFTLHLKICVILQSTMNGAMKCEVINATGKLNLPDICQQGKQFVLFKNNWFAINIGHFAQQTQFKNQKC